MFAAQPGSKSHGGGSNKYQPFTSLLSSLSLPTVPIYLLKTFLSPFLFLLLHSLKASHYSNVPLKANTLNMLFRFSPAVALLSTLALASPEPQTPAYGFNSLPSPLERSHIPLDRRILLISSMPDHQLTPAQPNNPISSRHRLLPKRAPN